MKFFLIVLTLWLTSCMQIHAQSYSPTYFSKVDFIEDLQYLSQKVLHIHPKLLLPAESERWTVMIDSIEKYLPDSISYNDAYIKASNALASLHDDHTDLFFSYAERKKYNEHGGLTMPFTVRINKNKIFINQYFGEGRSDRFSGAEILAINSINSKEILMKMMGLSGSKLISERYFGAYFWMFWGAQPEFRISIALHDSIFFITTKGVSSPEFFALKNNYYPEKAPQNYELTFLDTGSIALLRIKQFANDLAPFLRNAFDTIKNRNIKNLLIDVRNNPGGNSRSVDSLLNYLINKPYTQYSSVTLRVSDEVRKYYHENKPDIYQLIAQLPIDVFYKFDNKELIHYPIPKSNFFSGNIFVLANSHTYSAAATFTGVIKEYGLGKIIGQITGESIRYYGDYLTFKLPHIGEEFVVSPKEFIQHGGDFPDQGVNPDILLKDEDCTIEEIAKKYCNTHSN